MSFARCQHEERVRASAMTGRWPAEVTAHCESCGHCRDIRRVVEALQAPMASASPAMDATALWACGRQARRISIEARLSLVAAMVQIGALGSLLVVAVLLVDWPRIWDTINSMIAPGTYALVAGSGLALAAGLGVAHRAMRWLSRT